MATDIGDYWLNNPDALRQAGDGDMKEFARAMEILSLEELGTKIGLQWMKTTDNWKNVPSIDRYGTIWNKILRGSSEEVLAAKRRVAEHIFAIGLSRESLNRPDNISVRWSFIQETHPFLTQKQRLEAVDTLLALWDKPGQMEGLTLIGYGYAKWFMIRMNKENEFAGACAAAWINSTRTWEGLTESDFTWLEERLRRCLDGEFRYGSYGALVRLDLRKGQVQSARQDALNAFKEVATKDLSVLRARDLQAVEHALRAVDLYDKYMADRLDWKWLLLFRQLVEKGDKDRLEIWGRGLASLGSLARQRIPEAVLPELDKLLGVLAGSSDLRPQQVLADLLAYCEDSAQTKPLLQDRLNDLELACKAEHADDKIRGAVASGLKAKAAGQREDAINALKSVASAGRQNRELAQAACRCMLPLVARTRPLDGATLEASLATLTQAGMDLEPDVWNYTCQMLLAKMTSVGGEAQQEVWSNKSLQMVRGDRWISEETLAKLPRSGDLVSSGGEVQFRLRILTEMLLSTSDVSSMCRLARMRADALAMAKALPQAVAAARLAVLLAVGTQEGPRPMALHVTEVLKASGASAGDLQTVERCAFGNTAAATQAASGDKAAVGPVKDESLAEAAGKILAQAEKSLSGRRLGFLYLFAGQAEKGLRELCRTLELARPSAATTDDALNALAVATAVLDGNLWRANHIAMWILRTVGGA